MTRHLMLVPSDSCPARCRYCFGPRTGSTVMGERTLDAALEWAASTMGNGSSDRLDVVFHGGEPLTAGSAYYGHALPRLREAFPGTKLSLGMQTNLWLLDEELCDVLLEHNVSVGTSLDGPEDICDAQRGEGYFRRTMAGVELARSRGLHVGCIATFTRQSAPRADEAFEFMATQGLDFTIHAAVPPLRNGHADTGHWALTAREHGELLVTLLDLYLANMSRVRVSTLDHLCRSVSAGHGGVCTHADCLGGYLAVGPGGGIYPCQRFVGHERCRLGDVSTCPSIDDLSQHPEWRRFRDRDERVREECGDCVHFPYCRGGCPYDALAAGGGEFHTLRDPYCEAYKRVFGEITDRALAEVFSDENLQEVVDKPGDGSLLRRGPLIQLMRGDPHPRDRARNARQILGAVALAQSESIAGARDKLLAAGVARFRARTEAALESMRRRLDAPRALNNLYLHVTYGCNLACDHCYACAAPEHIGGDALSVGDVTSLSHQARDLGFRQVVVTGGEPLVHPEWDAMIEALGSLRTEIRPVLIMLRTNLAMPLTDEELARLGESVDKIAVSLDGDEAEHDARRGVGSYQTTLDNLRRLTASSPQAEVLLSAVMSVEDARGPRGEAVHAVARELGIRRVNFRPLLLLGRARAAGDEPMREAHWAYAGLEAALGRGVALTTTCGLGQNLYVGPDGETWPCYALTGRRWVLGNVLGSAGLSRVVGSEVFRSLSRHSVDTNEQCRLCAYRYLCGGACKAWGHHQFGSLDAPPAGCRGLHARARSLFAAALECLGIPAELWESSRLHLPECPSTPAA